MLSFSGRKILAESETWTFCVPDEESNNFYFLSKETEKFEPYISGIIYHGQHSDAAQHTQKLYGYFFADRHFFMGERGWIVDRESQLGTAQDIKFEFKIMCKPFPYGTGELDVREEYIFFDNLTPEQQLEADKWLERHGDYVRPYEFYPQ